MERTHLGLLIWLRAAWHMTNSKSGVSTLGLQRALGLRHKAAWHLTQKIRAAMAQSRTDRLKGTVEVDEVYVGGHEAGGQGAQRADSNKSTVLVASEQTTFKTKGGAVRRMTGRVRMRRSYDSSVWCLEVFIEENIEPGATLLTDGYRNYPPALRRLKARGLSYSHKPVSMRASTQKAHDLLPTVHRVAALMKRWLLGTHQGGVRDHQLEGYLDEFVFRYNRRRARSEEGSRGDAAGGRRSQTSSARAQTPRPQLPGCRSPVETHATEEVSWRQHVKPVLAVDLGAEVVVRGDQVVRLGLDCAGNDHAVFIIEWRAVSRCIDVNVETAHLVEGVEHVLHEVVGIVLGPRQPVLRRRVGELGKCSLYYVAADARDEEKWAGKDTLDGHSEHLGAREMS
jgi:hypothetical protein